MKKVINWTTKIISFIIAFTLIFFISQKILTPKDVVFSIPVVDNFYNLNKNSIDVLILGSSQAFCSVDPKDLNKKLNIESTYIGAGSQRIIATKYYLKEALKTQSPKIVFIEISQIFDVSDPEDDFVITNSYSGTKLSLEKVQSLYEYTNQDFVKTFYYNLPLLKYHSRFTYVNASDFINLFNSKENDVDQFRTNSHIKVEMAYLSEDPGETKPIPEQNIDAIRNINNICQENNINLIFYKAPLTSWTRNDSKAVKEFMKDKDLTYLDLNDFLDDFGFDANTDFSDMNHLSLTGSKKTTDFIAKYITENKLLN